MIEVFLFVFLRNKLRWFEKCVHMFKSLTFLLVMQHFYVLIDSLWNPYKVT